MELKGNEILAVFSENGLDSALENLENLKSSVGNVGFTDEQISFMRNLLNVLDNLIPRTPK